MASLRVVLREEPDPLLSDVTRHLALLLELCDITAQIGQAISTGDYKELEEWSEHRLFQRKMHGLAVQPPSDGQTGLEARVQSISSGSVILILHWLGTHVVGPLIPSLVRSLFKSRGQSIDVGDGSIVGDKNTVINITINQPTINVITMSQSAAEYAQQVMSELDAEAIDAEIISDPADEPG